MRLRALVILLATVIAAIVSTSAEEVRPPTVKIDKNLRRALLKALADLDTESAEQKSLTEAREASSDDHHVVSTPSESPIDIVQQTKAPEPVRTIFSFDGFPSDEETPSEDKLQNSTFVESDKYLAIDTSSANSPTTETTREDKNRAFQAHDVVLPDKNAAIYEKNPEIVNDQVGTRSVKTSSAASVNDIDGSSKKSSKFAVESLAISSSNGIATANALVSPSPTVSSPTTAQQTVNSTKTSESNKKEEQEVKIFQAPLVAAFTVQQDERGVPKSVVPIYGPNGDGQALTLQEQLDFKQKLLERQLAELQAQQIQQTQFLVRQQQIYEQQLRQKQQQQLYLQEQSRLKQIQEEQLRINQLEDQRNYQLQQQQQQQLQQQQQQQQKQAQHFSLNHQNGLLSLQPPFKTPAVNLQPSLALELPKSSQPPSFQPNFQDQLRIQQLQRQQQQQSQLQQQQQLQQARQQQLLQQQRLQSSFAGFPIDFQPPNSNPAQRFNRQEAFGAVGNFGFNDNRQQSTNNRNHFGFNQQSSRGIQSFAYNPYHAQQLQQQQQQQQQQYRPQRPQTPAKQIQHLLYQSGVAGDLGTVQGTGGQEDLNIVSKVLALNVGAIPTKNLRYTGNNFGNPA